MHSATIIKSGTKRSRGAAASWVGEAAIICHSHQSNRLSWSFMATAAQHVPGLPSLNRDISKWVDEVGGMTKPDRIHWCDGKRCRISNLAGRCWWRGMKLLPLNQGKLPGLLFVPLGPCGRWRGSNTWTFVCTQNREDAGPNNFWMSPREAHSEDGRALCRMHEGTHPVCRAVLHGPARFAVFRCGGGDHGQRLTWCST